MRPSTIEIPKNENSEELEKIDRLIEEKDWKKVIRSIAQLSSPEDCASATKRLIQAGQYDYAGEIVGHLVGSHPEIVEQIACNSPESHQNIKDVLYKSDRLTYETLREVVGGRLSPNANIAYSGELDCFEFPPKVEPLIDPGHQKDAQSMLEKHLKWGLYRGVVNILKMIPDKERGEVFEPVRDQLQEELIKALESEAWFKAHHLLEAFDSAKNCVLSPKKRRKVEEGYRREDEKRKGKRQYRKKTEGLTNLFEEMTSFYASCFIDHAVKQVQYSAFNWIEGRRREFRIQDTVFLNRTENQEQEKIDHTFNWVFYYLFMAVEVEAKGAPYHISGYPQFLRYGLSHRMPRRTDASYFFEEGTREELQLYFERSSLLFREADYGEWEMISDLGKDFTKENLSTDEKRCLIDRAFQIQHNNGYLFDKYELWGLFVERVDSHEIKKFLDMRADSRTLDEYQGGIRVDTSQQETALKRAQEILEKIAQIPQKEYGGAY